LTRRALRSLSVLAASLALHGAVVWVVSRFELPRPELPSRTPIVVTYADVPSEPEAVTPPPPPRRRAPRERPAPIEPALPEEPAPEPDTTDAQPTDADAPGDPDDGDAIATGESTGPAPDGPPVIPPGLRLFDRGALSIIARRSLDDAPKRTTLERWDGDAKTDVEAERRRVSGRLSDELGRIAAEENARAGLVHGCFDGIDQGFDDEIDCAAPGCAEHPACAGTRMWEATVQRGVPDDDVGGHASAIDVDLPGRVRAVSVRVEFAHPSPGDLAIVLEAPDGKEQVLRRADRSDPLYGRAFFAKELVGRRAQGTWRLRIMDVIAGAEGRFERWQLIVTPG